MAKAKTKQEKSPRLTLKRKTIILLGILLLILFIIAGVGIAKKLATDKVSQGQKDLLNRSLEATESVYSHFEHGIIGTKQDGQPPVNSCKRVGVKYSTEFNCGTKASLSVVGLAEGDYLTLDDRMADIYRSSEYFERVSYTQPHDNGLDRGLTGSVDSRIRGTDQRCYYISNYMPEEKAARFNWGCSLVAKTQLFPLGN